MLVLSGVLALMVLGQSVHQANLRPACRSPSVRTTAPAHHAGRGRGAALGRARNAASYDVRDDPTYLAFYLVLGAAWVGFFMRWLVVAGISTRDDVVERANGERVDRSSPARCSRSRCVTREATSATARAGGSWCLPRAWPRSRCCRVAAAGMVSGVSDVVTVDRDGSAARAARRVSHRVRRDPGSRRRRRLGLGRGNGS